MELTVFFPIFPLYFLLSPNKFNAWKSHGVEDREKGKKEGGGETLFPFSPSPFLSSCSVPKFIEINIR